MGSSEANVDMPKEGFSQLWEITSRRLKRRGGSPAESSDVNKAVKAGWAVERGWEGVMRGRGRRRVL